MKSLITLEEARKLPVGSVLAFPRRGSGFSGAFAVVAPGKVTRYRDADRGVRFSESIEDWMKAERTDEIHLVWRGKGKAPSRSTLNRHWDNWAEEWWARERREGRVKRNPSMSSDEFVEAVRERADVGQGYLVTRTRDFQGNYDQAQVTFYNVPEAVGRGGGGAVAMNNRLLLFVDGFGKQQGEPAKGKVKMHVGAAELLSGAGKKRPRGKTATPEKMADYVAGIISDASKLKPRVNPSAADDLEQYGYRILPTGQFYSIAKDKELGVIHSKKRGKHYYHSTSGALLASGMNPVAFVRKFWYAEKKQNPSHGASEAELTQRLKF